MNNLTYQHLELLQLHRRTSARIVTAACLHHSIYKCKCMSVGWGTDKTWRVTTKNVGNGLERWLGDQECLLGSHEDLGLDPSKHNISQHTYLQCQDRGRQRQEEWWGLMAASLALGSMRGPVSKEHKVEPNRGGYQMPSSGFCPCTLVPIPAHTLHAHAQTFLKGCDKNSIKYQ